MGFGRKVEMWDQLDRNLKTYAHMAVGSLIGCSWCLDFNYFKAHNEGFDEAKASEVPRCVSRPSSRPPRARRDGVREAMSETPPRATDELTERLLKQLGALALVELTAVVGFANSTATGDTALEIESQRFLQGVQGAAGATLAQDRDLAMREDAFARHRRLLFTVAYEMLVWASDA